MSGEDQKVRDAMERMRGQLIGSGVKPEQARKIAQEQAIKHDRKERDKR